MASLSCRAYVLHSRPYRETSAIIDFFTAEYGRLSAVAKGIRAARSERKSLLQPLHQLQIELAGRSALKQLLKVESVKSPVSLPSRHLYAMFYVNELLVRALAQSDPADDIFAAYEVLLQQLSTQQQELLNVEPILREFEFILLQSMGYFPDLSTDSSTGDAVSADQLYGFDVSQGVISGQHSAYQFHGRDLLAVSQSHWQPESLRTAKQLSRLLLPQLIGNKPLKSRELFVSLKVSTVKDD